MASFVFQYNPALSSIIINEVSLNLESTRAKIERSRHHAQTIKDEVATWFRKNPYSISYNANDQFTRYSVLIHLDEHPPNIRWSLMFADGIHNLRCSLDHLIYAIAIHDAGGKVPPGADTLQFPISDSLASFNNSNTQRRIRTFSASVRTAIEAMQPYNRPHKNLPAPLSLLRDFANTDKHKLLQLAFVAVHKGELNFRVDYQPPNLRTTMEVKDVEIKNGAEIATIIFDRPTPDVYMGEYDIIPLLCLAHQKGPIGSIKTDFDKLLTIMTDEVLYIVDKISAVVK